MCAHLRSRIGPQATTSRWHNQSKRVNTASIGYQTYRRASQTSAKLAFCSVSGMVTPFGEDVYKTDTKNSYRVILYNFLHHDFWKRAICIHRGRSLKMSAFNKGPGQLQKGLCWMGEENREVNHRSVQQFVRDAKWNKPWKDGKQRYYNLDESKSVQSIPWRWNLTLKPLRILCTCIHKTRH